MEQLPLQELGPDVLYLPSRLQVEIALDVLVANGINPTGQVLLKDMLDTHAVLTSAGAQEDLVIYLQGEHTRELRADIGMAAVMVEQSQGVSEDQRIAVRGLLDVLGLKRQT